MGEGLFLTTDVFSPAYRGQSLSITFSAESKKTITEGAYIKVVVKYGLIQLFSTTADLCEQSASLFNPSCPLEPGKIQVTKSVDLPSVIPPVCDVLLLS